ncbi:MAG: elongation factor Ts [Bacteroidetes bacterium SW_10_40_5]|nr:MAG: elongation factor Ts [Bacteroidetes bacterium SW_10_40_5]
MGISASDVQQLRNTTGAGMMDCKKALEETGGDFDEAINYLRKKGQKVSAKRSDKEANEGIVLSRTTDDHNTGIVFSINCETDFVAKNQDFQGFAGQVADEALRNLPAQIDEIYNLEIEGKKVQDLFDEKIAQIGEKLTLSEYEKMEADHVVAYNHFGNQIGVLVGFENPNNADIQEAASDIAMQVAAMSPLATNEDGIPEDVLNREFEYAKESAQAEGKPEHVTEKIAQGRMKKFYKENTLLDQDFVKDSSKTVKDYLAEIDKDLKIKEFKRVAVAGN